MMWERRESRCKHCMESFSFSVNPEAKRPYAHHICHKCKHARTPERDCKFCGTKFKRLNAQSCRSCSAARSVYSHFGSGRYLAGLAVAKARAKNQIPSAREFSCVDCAGRATEYDHRDYQRELEIAPVCRGCNARRGMAKRKDWSFDEFWAWFGEYKEKHGDHRRWFSATKEQLIPYCRQYWPELSPPEEKAAQS